MNKRLSLVASIALSFAVTGLTLTACQSDDTPAGGDAGEGGASGTTSGTAGTNAGTAGTGAGTAGASGGGAAGTTNGTAGTAGSSSGTAGASGTSSSSCTPTNPDLIDVPVTDVANPGGSKGDLAHGSASGKSAFVSLTVQATTPKILVSHSKTSHSCLWGFYGTAQDGTVAEYGSIQIVGYGAKDVTDPDDATKTLCPEDEGSTNTGTTPTGAGWIPNTLKPGDIVHVSGFVSEYPENQTAQASCTAGVAKRGQRQVSLPDDGCITVTPGSPTFQYKEFSSIADINKLADLADDATQLKWAGAPIKITGSFTPRQATAAELGTSDKYNSATDAVTKYGDLYLTETNLLVTNSVLFKEVLNDANKRYDYPLTTTFTSIEGILYRDFCGWDLSTTDTCTQISPKASTCP